MLLSLSIENNNTLLIRYYYNGIFYEQPIVLSSPVYSYDEYTLHKLFYDYTTVEEREFVLQECAPDVSMLYIGVDAANNHHQDYSNHNNPVVLIAISYNDCVLAFSTIRPSKDIIKKLKVKYGLNKAFFTFFETEKELLKAFNDSYTKGIQFLCFWDRNKQLPYLKSRYIANGLEYEQVIGNYDYRKVLDHFSKAINSQRSYSGHTLQSVAKKALNIELQSNPYNTSLEFTNDHLKYFSYIFDYVFAFKSIDLHFETTKYIFYSASVANVDCMCVVSPTAISNNMLYNAYIENNIPYTKSNKDKTYSGAFSMPPAYPLVKHLISFDFKSSYINILMAFKISPENIIEDANKENDGSVVLTVNGVKFKNDKNENVISTKILSRFYSLRKK